MRARPDSDLRAQIRELERRARLEPSRRHLEVLQLVAEGFSDGEVAEVLHLSEATIGSHVKAVRKRLGVTTRAGAVAEGLRRGLIA